MQNDETKKTKSARKTIANNRDSNEGIRWLSNRPGLLIVATVLLVLAFAVGSWWYRDQGRVDMSYFKIETAASDDARMQGLGGHAPLKSNEAMLFDFTDGANGQCFWMKDMTFNIDIIWLDSNKYVYKVVQNISPDTYPEESFCTNQNPAYVLETAAGRAAELGIDIGKQLKL